MAYFYEFELILAGIILLSAMTAGGIKIWLKKRSELEKSKHTQSQEQDQNFWKQTLLSSFSTSNFSKKAHN